LPLKIDDQDQLLAEHISRFNRLFVLTGAGCSTRSGLGDYRNTKGEWKRKQPITGQTFIGSELARKRYWARSSVGWPSFHAAQPGDAHHALRKLQEQKLLSTLVTQNVDQLHQKAGHKNVVDLHGVLSTVSCVDCDYSESRNQFQAKLLSINTWLKQLSARHAPDGDADLETDKLDRMDVPECPQCGGLLKPDVVFFGENVPKQKVQNSLDELRHSDALLVVGSSLMVYSGFRFCRDAQKRGQAIIIINDGVTRADDLAQLKITGDCGERLIKLTAAVAQS